MQTKKKVIAISGMPGSGKGAAADTARELGLKVLVLGDIIREETERQGLQPTPENMGTVMLQVRANEGPAVVAKRMVPRIEASPSSTAIVEGVRSPDELAELRSKYEVATVAIHSSPKTRFQRLLSRNRTDDPHNLATFNERDTRELSVGVGHVIALADIVLVNEGTIEELQAAFREALAKLGAK